MSRCIVHGCRFKSQMQYLYKTKLYPLCWKHGMNMTRAEVVSSIGSIDKPKSYKQKAKYNSMSVSTSSSIDKHKDTLCLENYKELTGKRFRKTKDQVDRSLSREEAFLEFMESI